MLEFGKKVRVGNFYIIKLTKSLSSKEVKELRKQSGIAPDIAKRLERGGLPYIKVSTISENWNIQFAVGTTMFLLIENEYDKLEDGGLTALHNLFLFMYSDTSVIGDQQYINDKAAALKSFMERCKPADKDESDEEILSQMKSEEDTKEVISEVAKDLADKRE